MTVWGYRIMGMHLLCLCACCLCRAQPLHYTKDTLPLLPQAAYRAATQPPQPVIYIRAINAEGNKRTRQHIVEREYALATNTPYTAEELARRVRLTQEQLMNTALFVTVEVAIDTLTQDEVDIHIILKERWYLFPVPHFRLVDRNLNVWINEFKGSLSRAEIGGKVAHHNLTGRNDKLNLYAIGGYASEYRGHYFQPYFDKKLRQGYSLGFVYSQNREVNYATDSNRQQFFQLPDFGRETLRAEVGYSYRKGSQMRSAARLSYNRESVDSAIVALNPNMFGKGRTRAEFVDLHLSYQYLGVDYIPYPLRGWMVDFYSLNRFSASIPLFQLGGRMLATWSFAPKTYVNFQSAFAFNIWQKDQPFFNTRMLGYRSLYMQGLEYYVADGNLAGMIRTTLRREILAFTLRNVVPYKSHADIPFRFFLKTYGNLGYAHNPNPGTSFMNNRLLRTAGLGLDVLTVYDLVLKLEYSFNQFGESGFYIHTATSF